MTDYKFTQDWFHWAPEVWKQLIPLLPTRKSFLEIGSFEGRSTVWIVENMMEGDGNITCIDTWEGGEEHINGEISGAEESFLYNMELLQTRKAFGLSVRKGKSVDELAACLAAGETYDFIYIDGSHIAKDVLTDACMAWPLLKKGGLMVFDDYMWGNPRDILHRPKIAVDAFTTMFAEELDIVHMGYQFVVRKK
jgi:predicted O-methyltransferase YrrM